VLALAQVTHRTRHDDAAGVHRQSSCRLSVEGENTAAAAEHTLPAVERTYLRLRRLYYHFVTPVSGSIAITPERLVGTRLGRLPKAVPGTQRVAD
jgi:hypothetical protein